MADAKDYQNWSREKLIHEYKELLKRKKFGIVWEDKIEEVAEQCKKFLPVLKENKSKAIKTWTAPWQPAGPNPQGKPRLN